MKRGEVLEKETYNIDDILAEVKKHKEDQERKEHPEKFFEDKNETVPEKENVTEEEKAKQENSQEQPHEEFEIQEVSPDEEETEKEKTERTAETKERPAEKTENETPETPQEETQKPQQEENVSDSEKDSEDLNIVEKEISDDENDEPEIIEKSYADQKEQEELPKEEEIKLQPDENGMVDILQAVDNQQKTAHNTPKKNEKVKFFKTKKGKAVKRAILCIVVVLVVAGIVSGVVLNNMLSNIAETDDGDTYNASTYYDGMDFLQEEFPEIEEVSASEVSGYRDYLKNWYENGDPVRSSHVLNVLLIGEDTREEQISEASRADSAIIASVNIDTGTIHMTSVLRDLYVYYEVEGEGHYGKINESASLGGINTYIATIERNFKIAIDGYAIVNFASFPKIIDSLGGVEINITEAEINEINNHPGVYNDVGDVYIEKTFDGSEGVMKLDGIQALAYCRIRHIDSDDKRADRQKTVLNEILNKVKSSSTVDAVKAVNQLSKYTKTSYSKKELISIGNLALRDNWLSYDIKSSNVPTVENRKGGQNFSASYNNWIWLADIPEDAYNLQTTIYGKSNIKLNENRADYISLGQ